MSFRTNALLAGLTLVAVSLSACGDDDDAPLTAASGGSAGAKAGAAGAAGAKAGAAGTTSGGTGGVTAGGTGGTTAGAAGTTTGGSGGAAAGSAGATAAGSAGATAAGSAGAAGNSAGAAGTAAGGSAGSTAGGAAGSGDAGSSAGGAAGTAAGGSAGAAAGSAGAGGSVDEPVPNFAAIALGPGGDIYRFDTNNPGGAAKASAVAAGLGGASLALVGIDYRPSDGLLYGATNTSLHVLGPGGLLGGNNLVAGATQTFDPNLANAGQGFDFNPAANISVDGSGNPLRVVGYADASNSRYNPTNGKRLGADVKLAYNDALNTNQPQIAGSAYTNNIKGATETKLFALDGRTDAILQQEPPNNGVLTHFAPLGVDVTDLAGFDIVTVVGPDSAVKNYGFAVIGDSLYTIRLTQSTEPAAKLVGKVAGASQLRGLAVELAPK